MFQGKSYMKLVSGSLEGFKMQADIGDERYLSQQEYITVFCLLMASPLIKVPP